MNPGGGHKSQVGRGLSKPDWSGETSSAYKNVKTLKRVQGDFFLGDNRNFKVKSYYSCLRVILLRISIISTASCSTSDPLPSSWALSKFSLALSHSSIFM
jgi:hypothetical protein